MKTRLLGGIAALLVAIIGTVLLATYVQNADKRALASTETENIYIVQKSIPAGASAEAIAGSVTKKAVPKLAIAENNVTDLASLGSKVSAVALMPGEQLLSSRMVEQNAFLGPARVQVPSGLQEITLKLPIERVAGGMLKAGDTVGVFLSLEDTGGQAGGKVSKTQLSFHKVLVTAAQFSDGAATQTGTSDTASGTSQVSSTSSSKSQGDGNYLITMARNSADAERIVFAAEFGKIYLSKEPGDAVESTKGVVDTAGLFR
ncbi:RcpC/CpaB family pilus assembly protein [Arthrobacter sp. I3]|uniref:Flp pilus assembly protein CpaB n=1 Tax=Arthrobacter sp. I3 TaxID=218158 RepID=UPI000480EB06|nr:RcpC/CpaB family pilus assembly protein [Arthrobacter sp. I3]